MTHLCCTRTQRPGVPVLLFAVAAEALTAHADVTGLKKCKRRLRV